LGAQDGVDSKLSGTLRKTDDAAHVHLVGQGDCRVTELNCALDEILGLRGPPQE
jgi:hypothetical protein